MDVVPFSKMLLPLNAVHVDLSMSTSAYFMISFYFFQTAALIEEIAKTMSS